MTAGAGSAPSRAAQRPSPGAAGAVRAHDVFCLYPTPRGHVAALDGQVFVLSTSHPRSWDSRYFGNLPLAVIRGTVREVWTW